MNRARTYNLAILTCAIGAVWVWTRPFTSQAPRPFRVTFLDVGQGDAAVVESPGGAVMVIDAGRSFEDGDTGRQIVLPFLRSRGINRIHALALTHADDDHIGGARTLLGRIRVDRVLLPFGESTDPAFVPALQVASERRIPIMEVGAGQTIDFGSGVTAEILNPLPELRSEEKDNDRSLVFRLRRGQTSLLLTGDIEESAEFRLSRTDVTADILKAPHHGSKTSTSVRFLDRIRPQVVVVSAGHRNSFGHPHRLVLERCQKRGILVLRTDQHGAVTVESDGQTLRIATEGPLR